ncbi:MAG: hypothetical protein M1829_001834 [Trizodia sp. TS-e1964]|nr:MAG: hypothetical protein M1829_001834 [Trizodia sp. TS-e1964]
MPLTEVVRTDNAPAPLPFYSQALKCNGMVYCSGALGNSPSSGGPIVGSVAERTAQALRNLSAILEAAGSRLQNVVKVTVYLTSMDDFAAMNSVYASVINWEPKPVRTCIAVKELPFATDVEIECIAHL